jgi:outer membrane protein assembly factor BamE (lipoprotein component of BamABCDE complex)
MGILQSVSRFVLVLALCVSCSGKRITKANVDQVTDGMSKKQVESILGPPTSLSTEDFVIMKANVDQVTEGMSKKQVESILGQPTSSKTEDPTIMKQTTYVYRQGKDTITIIFKDDKLQSKDSTLSN